MTHMYRSTAYSRVWSQNTMLVSLKPVLATVHKLSFFVFLSLQLVSYQKCCTLFIIMETIMETHSSKVPVIQLPCINRCICRTWTHPVPGMSLPKASTIQSHHTNFARRTHLARLKNVSKSIQKSDENRILSNSFAE